MSAFPDFFVKSEPADDAGAHWKALQTMGTVGADTVT